MTGGKFGTEKPAWSYFIIPGLAFIAAVFAALLFAGPEMAFTVAVLSVLEVSLSFDNAVVNAAILQHWSAKWRKLFMGVGILVAVVGMRFIFPIMIVSVAASIGPWDTLMLALEQPAVYAEKLSSIHGLVASFGGSFLMMVGLGFFMDAEKEHHWLGPIEKLLSRLGQIEAVQAAATLGIVCLASGYFAPADRLSFVVAGIAGVCAFVGARAVGTLLGGGDGSEDGPATKIIQAGIGGFLYLELLDASFSFDGVIGAFALTNNLIWIMVGLGVGALAVREMTVLAVDRGTLAEYVYLEHGAFWAILSLATLMFVGAIVEVPEAVTGLIGAGFILAAFVSSIIKARNRGLVPAQ